MSVQVRGFLTKTFANRIDSEYLQESLTGLGYHPGPVDGRFGNRTERAVVAFQNKAGLDPNGYADGPTWAALQTALNPPKAAAKPAAKAAPKAKKAPARMARA